VSDVVKLATLIASAVKVAVDTAEALGLKVPGVDKAREFEEALNEQAAKLLPHELTALSLLVNALSVKVSHQVASLGTAPRCPMCSQVATQTIAHSPHTGKSTYTLSCSFCGWAST
jgi:hypothetical protein